MSNLTQNNNSSPFDSIRRTNEDGKEFWNARELMAILGYAKWQFFGNAISRAIKASDNSGNPSYKHFLLTSVKSNGRPKEDYKLSRHGCYLVAMNCDPDKIEVAAAQSYFAIKTREAEVVIPAQSDRIKELELELAIRQLDSTMVTLHGAEVVLALRGAGQVVHVEVPVTEILEPATRRNTKILTADQLKLEVKKRTGQNPPSLKWFADVLRNSGRDDLLVAVTRHSTSEYPIPEKLDEAIAVVYATEQQRLIGQ